MTRPSYSLHLSALPRAVYLLSSEKRQASAQQDMVHRTSKLFADNPERYLLLRYVSSHVIDGMLPFNFMERETRRSYYRLLNREIDVQQLNAKRVSYRASFRAILLKAPNELVG